jgi:hypothetical protein
MQDPLTAPTAQGVLVIDETGDRKDGTKTAHVGRQYLGSIGKVDNGVVAVTSLWADAAVYYPLDVEPYTPAPWFAKGKTDPAFRTKPMIALTLVKQALARGLPFRAVVADAFYGEHTGFKHGLRQLKLGYVVALKPSHAWWHPVGTLGSLEEAARAAPWHGVEAPGAWVRVVRTFRDNDPEGWWALEVRCGPYGPDRPTRAVVATTDPATLPPLTTWYLETNFPAPTAPPERTSALAAADLAEIVQLYGLRMWVEQSYKQIKNALGWTAYQVRSDRALRRHWQLVCCAFSFCWWAQSQLSHPDGNEQTATPPVAEALPPADPLLLPAREKIGASASPPRPGVTWPVALRAVRAWLEPWLMLGRYWRAWSGLPPPRELQRLLDWVGQGHGLYLYDTS